MHLHLCLNGPMEEVKRCQQEECLAAAAVMEVAVAGERQAYHEEFGEEEGAFAVDAFAVEDASASVAHKGTYNAQNQDQEAFLPDAYTDTIKNGLRITRKQMLISIAHVIGPIPTHLWLHTR